MITIIAIVDEHPLDGSGGVLSARCMTSSGDRFDLPISRDQATELITQTHNDRRRVKPPASPPSPPPPTRRHPEPERDLRPPTTARVEVPSVLPPLEDDYDDGDGDPIRLPGTLR